MVFDLYNSYTGLWVLSLVLALVAAALSVGIRPQPATTSASSPA